MSFFGQALFFLLIVFGPGLVRAQSCTIAALKQKYPDFCNPIRQPQALSDQQMKTLFSEIQRDMGQMVLAGRSVDQLSPEEKSLLTRIETVEFEGFRDCGDIAGRVAVSAAYSQMNHSIYLCKGLRDFPLASLVGIVGHEIGHTGDSCSSQCTLYHSSNRSGLRVPEEQRQRDSLLRHSLSQLQTGTGPIFFTSTPFIENPEVLNAWTDEGLIQPRAEAMPLTRYPLNRIRSCLMNRENLWQGRSSQSLPTTRDNSPGCNNTVDYESMADVWGALALGRYLKARPELRGAAALSLLENRKHEICSPKGYPATIKRLEAIWLAEPQVAAALGCTPTGTHTCIQESPFPARSSPRAGGGRPGRTAPVSNGRQ